jgi:hypothetical protein
MRPRVSYLSRHSFREPGGTGIGFSGIFSAAGAPKESCVEQEADGSRASEMNRDSEMKLSRSRGNLTLLPEPGLDVDQEPGPFPETNLI